MDRQNQNQNNYSVNPFDQQLQGSNAPQNTFHQLYEGIGNPTDIPQTSIPTYNTPELTTNGVCKKFIHGKCRQG